MPDNKETRCTYLITRKNGTITGAEKVERIYDIEDGLAIVLFSSKKYGFIDSSGDIAIKPRFSSVRPFRNGMASVCEEDKWGLINRQGDYIIKPRFDAMSDFSEGLAEVTLNGKSGYVDTAGEFVIEPVFDGARDFHNGVALVRLNDGFGFIDTSAKFIVEPDYYYIGQLQKACENSDNVRLTEYFKFQEFEFPKECREAGFSNGQGLTIIHKKNKLGVAIESGGHKLIPAIYDRLRCIKFGGRVIAIIGVVREVLPPRLDPAEDFARYYEDRWNTYF